MAKADRTKRVLVIGGGIGGLAAATALARRGLDVDIIEARRGFDLQGVGLGQPANALRALQALHVLDEVLEVGYLFDRLKFFDYDGRFIAEHRFLLGGEDVPPFGALPRADLYRILRTAAKKAGLNVRMGTTVGQIEDEGDHVEVRFNGGSSGQFDIVAGFDGVHSATRAMLFGGAYNSVYTGYAAWRLLAERAPSVTAMEFYQGLGSKTGVMPLRKDLMYLFHVRPESGEWQDPAHFVPSLRERLADYGGVAGDIRDGLSETDEIVYSPIETILVQPPWHRGRVLIGGDAAHASPPHLTQGAAMAMEDGLVLAEELTADKPLADALNSYSRRRFDRCRFVQEFSMDMLRREQAVRTMEELEAMKADLVSQMLNRLGSADRIMNQRVFDAVLEVH